MNRVLDSTEEAKDFICKLLDDTLSWGCTDFQHDHAKEFVEILGDEFVPEWIRRNSSDAAEGE